jgi:hypothetical protein
MGLGVCDGLAEALGDGEMVVEGAAAGSFDPPEQPVSATRTSRAQTGPMVRTRRA